jgi:hypothetical protein
MEIDAKAILRAIALTGAASEENAQSFEKVATPYQMNTIMTRSYGLPKISPYQAKKFSLIMERPKIFEVLHPSEIQCACCKRMISYPAWYWVQRFNVNHFHYFICYNPSSPEKVTSSCYRPELFEGI